MIDQQFATWLFNIRSPGLVDFFSSITQLGGSVFIATLAVIIATILIYQKKRLEMLGLIITVAGSGASMLAIKHLIQRPRPVGIAAIVEDSYSFPSGHGTLSMALYGYLIYLLWLTKWSRAIKICFAILLAVLIILVGFSRLYLGVHYLTDVLAGLALGAVWIWFAVRLAGRR